MGSFRLARYVAPNLVTCVGMCFGLMSMAAAHQGRFVEAAWLIIWAVLLDRVDGMVARLLHATSPFGVQMDSLADSMNFGVAPAFLIYVSLSQVTELGFDHGPQRLVLMAACGVWVLAGVFRLAKFNVIAEESTESAGVFFGVATTLAAGTLCIWYIVLHKYSPPGASLGSPEAFIGPKLFGSWQVRPQAWAYLPGAMFVAAALMASNVPSPKLGKSPSPVINLVLAFGVITGFGCGFGRVMPDFMALLPSIWLVVSLAWGQLSPTASRLQPPPFLPK